jgi:hypothetical protein
LHTESRAVLSYAAVLEREYKALAASKSWRKWCGLIAAKYSTAADFVAACYPSVLENGQPARPVNYTNGTTIYRAFRPLVYADTCGAGAVAVLCKALDGFKKAHTRAANKAADKGGALVLNKVYKDGQAVAAYNAVTESRTDKDGREYTALVSAGKATISADMLAKINVTNAGKDGHRLPTLAEYNADLRK